MSKGWLATLGLLAACSGVGELHPIVTGAGDGEGDGSTDGGTGVAAQGEVFFVEPFGYHYPDEGEYSSIGNAVRITLTLGEYEPGTFVYVAQPSDGVLRLEASDLVGPEGSVFPADWLDLGVVTFADRSHPEARLEMGWLGGLSRGSDSDWTRGFHDDLVEHLPLVPDAIVSDAIEFAKRKTEASPAVVLTQRSDAVAAAEAGHGTQFWITAHVPHTFEPPNRRSSYRGVLTLWVDDHATEVPIEVDVVRLTLDSLAEHGRHVGVIDPVPASVPQFADAALDDVQAHGVTAAVARLPSATDYAPFADRGIALVLNRDPNFDAAAVDSAGFLPFGFADVADGAAAVQAAQALHERGARFAGAASFDIFETVLAEQSVDYWAHPLSAYEVDAIAADEFDVVLDHLDDVRGDPTAKRAAVEAHASEALASHAPLQARLLFGYWLHQSGLDGALASGYANLDALAGDNPLSEPYLGVAYPALLVDDAGDVVQRRMLPTPTWEAMREGIDDFRYALTAERLVAEFGNDTQRDLLASLLADYGALYDGGDRVDFRNRLAELRVTRAAMLNLISGLVPP